MLANGFSIKEYKSTEALELLRLLLELQSAYFKKTASIQIQQLNEEHNIKKSYSDYVNFLNENNNGNWKVFLATSAENKIVGFIIGSITSEDALIRNNIGHFEDWFVEDEYRKKGIGMELYNELEKWFKEKGCQQIVSEIWEGNELSRKAHEQLGFFVSGISFGKILK
jgi:aminoglycoside 6'-N-acetyltransferase I